MDVDEEEEDLEADNAGQEEEEEAEAEGEVGCQGWGLYFISKHMFIYSYHIFFQRKTGI